MSKVDAQRAMRDARYAAYEARRKSAGDPVTPPPAAAPRPAAARAAVAPSAAAPSVVAPGALAEPETVAAPEITAPQPETAQGLCGHRSIGNKSCTRPAGHPEKSHRYS